MTDAGVSRAGAATGSDRSAEDAEGSGMVRGASKTPWLSLAMGVGIGLVLAWLVVVRSLPVALGDHWPDLALMLDSRQPRALLVKAEQLRQRFYKLALPAATGRSGGGSSGDASRTAQQQAAAAAPTGNVETQRTEIRVKMRRLLKRLLRRDPMNAVAFRMLGEIETDTRRARAYMQSATARSKREPIAVFWLLNDALVRRDTTTALELAEVLFRSNTPLRRYAVASFAQLAADPKAAGLLAQKLRNRPWWRHPFFVMLPEFSPDPSGPLNVMMALKAAGDRPTGDEVGRYVWDLFRRNQFGLAYYAWLNLLPEEAMARMGLINNGGFDESSAGEPFNWHFTSHDNATVSMQPAPDGKDGDKALQIVLGMGRVKFPKVRQYLKLPPGEYVLNGRYRGRIKSSRGLIWRAFCVDQAGKHHAIGMSDQIAGNARQWADFSFTFKFADEGVCALVLVQLEHTARTASENFIEGEVWFDALKLAAVRN